MNDKFQNKYRIPSARLGAWDYGNNGSYFITICTQNRAHYFGEIVKGKMQLNAIGKLAEQQWMNTPALRPDMNLELGNFVVMPNHFHGILVIGNNEYNTNGGMVNTGRDLIRTRRDAMHRVSTNANTASHRVPAAKNKFAPQSKNLASVIRGFKSSVTTCAKKIGISGFSWQPRFYDIIIRNTESFERIQNYIATNPKNWKEDKFNL